MALAAVQRIDAIFDIERAINGKPAAERLAARQQFSASLSPISRRLDAAERAKLSRHNDVAKAMDYMLNRWSSFSRFLSDGRICLSNNAAERAIRSLALGAATGCSPAPTAAVKRAAKMYSLIIDSKNERHRPAGMARRHPRQYR